MTADEDIGPFRIDVPEADIDDLHRRLDAARWPDELPGVGWSHGVAGSTLAPLARYWRAVYDWRAHEARLNTIPQFTTTIDGLLVHFLHVRSAHADATPLLVTHGWPSTVADLTGILGPLTSPEAHGDATAPAFHVVAPSLPGYGFSGPLREAGWGVERTAQAWAELMRRLGYDRYLVQGGDIGSLVSPPSAVSPRSPCSASTSTP